MDKKGVEEDRVMPPEEGGGGGAPSAMVRGVSLSGTRCSVAHPSVLAGCVWGWDWDWGFACGWFGSCIVVCVGTGGSRDPGAGPRHFFAASDNKGYGMAVSINLPQ
mmetsp:Transcript_24759/g.50196  ORF Transcript_24759/g.50196 Transcript_24759/m.50196 type:complete len:106 (-) Transcript_24759:627-944(-)